MLRAFHSKNLQVCYVLAMFDIGVKYCVGALRL